MELRALGSQGLRSTAVALGCMGMSGTYGPRDEKESIATIHEAIERGVNLLDTGDFYGMGHNELLIREAIRGRRDKVQLSVKFGAMRNHDGTWLGNDARPAAIRNFLAYSLVRLGVDTIDFYFPARVDPAVPIEDVMGTLAGLIREGKVRYAGLSEAAPGTVERAHKEHPVSAVQIEYSLFSRDIEAGLLPATRRLGIGIFAYGAFSRGLFSGAVAAPADFAKGADIRRNMPRFNAENLPRNLALLETLQGFARRKGCTVSQLCVAWVLAQGKDLVVLAGTTRRQHLGESLAAAEIALSPAELAELERLVPRGAVAGERYAAAGLASVNR
jgi:aryl-alcohol dehydrogenase-like predicted oxidoreductase